MLFYSQKILDHYKQPRNFGIIEKADLKRAEFNPSCGDKLILFFKISEDKKILDIKFSGSGCALSIAAASIFTCWALGKELSEVKNLSKEEFFKILGVEVNPGRIKCALLVFSAATKL